MNSEDDPEARLERLVAHVPGMLYQYVLQTDGTEFFTYASPGCRHLYDAESESLLEDFSQVWAIIHPDDRERVNQINHRSAQQLERFDIEFRLCSPLWPGALGAGHFSARTAGQWGCDLGWLCGGHQRQNSATSRTQTGRD